MTQLIGIKFQQFNDAVNFECKSQNFREIEIIRTSNKDRYDYIKSTKGMQFKVR